MLVDLAKLLRGGDRERATGRGRPGGGNREEDLEGDWGDIRTVCRL